MRFDFSTFSTEALKDLAIHIINQPYDEGRDVLFDTILTVLLDRYPTLIEYHKEIHHIETARPVDPFTDPNSIYWTGHY